MKKNILYILSLIALAGCASNDLTDNHREPAIVGDEEIVLTSGVGASTRAVINSTLPAAGIDVSILRLDKTGTPATFPAWGAITAADIKSAHVNSSNAVKFNDGAGTDTHEYYLADGNDTRLQGWYPKNSVISNAKLTWNFTGAEDIMVSNYQDGNKETGNRFGSSKVLTFEHMLTQIVVKVYGADQAAADAWGGIIKVSIKDQKKTCMVELKDLTSSASEFVPTFSGTPEPLDLQKLNTDDSALTPAYDPAKGMEYDVTNDKSKANICGYAMFQPIAAGASNKLVLLIKTEKGGTLTQSISTPDDGGLKPGTAYNVVLRMTSTEIEPEVAITPWKTGADMDVEM